MVILSKTLGPVQINPQCTNLEKVCKQAQCTESTWISRTTFSKGEQETSFIWAGCQLCWPKRAQPLQSFSALWSLSFSLLFTSLFASPSRIVWAEKPCIPHLSLLMGELGICLWVSRWQATMESSAAKTLLAEVKVTWAWGKPRHCTHRCSSQKFYCHKDKTLGFSKLHRTC